MVKRLEWDKDKAKRLARAEDKLVSPDSNFTRWPLMDDYFFKPISYVWQKDRQRVLDFYNSAPQNKGEHYYERRAIKSLIDLEGK